MSILLYENFRAVFYTPFYLTHALGAYDAEGVEVTLGTNPDPDTVAAQLRAGSVDVCWGGPMRIMLNHDRDPDCTLVGFCEVVARDPFFIVGPKPRPDFQFSDLASLTLASVSEVPTPWMCLQDDLRRAGMDPDAIDRVADRSMPENTEALRAGTVDAVQLFQPFVETLVADGGGHIWYAAATRGPCSYTTFYAEREALTRREDELHRMTRAVYRMQKWLHSHDAAETAAAVQEYFPDLPQDILTGAIARYLNLGIWGKNPLHGREGFERLRTALLSGGLIEREIPYEDCVDLRFAEAVIAEDPPSM